MIFSTSQVSVLYFNVLLCLLLKNLNQSLTLITSPPTIGPKRMATTTTTRRPGLPEHYSVSWDPAGVSNNLNRAMCA